MKPSNATRLLEHMGRVESSAVADLLAMPGLKPDQVISSIKHLVKRQLLERKDGDVHITDLGRQRLQSPCADRREPSEPAKRRQPMQRQSPWDMPQCDAAMVLIGKPPAREPVVEYIEERHASWTGSSQAGAWTRPNESVVYQ